MEEKMGAQEGGDGGMGKKGIRNARSNMWRSEPSKSLLAGNRDEAVPQAS